MAKQISRESIGTNIGIVHAPQSFDYDETEIRNLSYSKYEIVGVKRVNINNKWDWF